MRGKQLPILLVLTNQGRRLHFHITGQGIAVPVAEPQLIAFLAEQSRFEELLHLVLTLGREFYKALLAHWQARTVNASTRMPCQLVRADRRLTYRLLNWNP